MQPYKLTLLNLSCGRVCKSHHIVGAPCLTTTLSCHSTKLPIQNKQRKIDEESERNTQ